MSARKPEQREVLELSKREYEELFTYAYIGQFINFGYHHPGEKKMEELNDLLQHLMSYGEKYKTKWIEKVEGGKNITEKKEKEILTTVMRYNQAVIEEAMEEMENGINEGGLDELEKVLAQTPEGKALLKKIKK